MFDLSLLSAVVREKFAARTLPREPEPDLVMNGEEETAAYAAAGREDKDFAAVNLFHLANICQLVQDKRTVVDLGCGPATLLVEVAKLNPQTNFVGVDLSDKMIAIARNRIEELGLTNVSIRKCDITVLDFIADGSADAVVSTVAFHHLPSLPDLTNCFRQIARILAPQGALYLVDFARFKSLKTVIYFAYLNEKGQPPASHPYYLDYERSMRAAFLHDDYVALCGTMLSQHARAYTTSPVPFLTVVSSKPERPIAAHTLAEITQRRTALPKQSKKRLAQLLSHFRTGGLPLDALR